MKIAVYGGSFNPPHLGHVTAARAAIEALRPDRLLIIPTSTPPHKQLEQNSPSPAERLKLCRLAFGDIPGAEVSDLEIRRKGKSYTADTVAALRGEYPGAELCLVVGTDMFLSFRSWNRWQAILEGCTLAVMSREEDDREAIVRFKAALEAENGARVVLISHRPLPMSSTEIRDRLRRRRGAEELPPAVYERVIRKNLYGARAELSWLRQMVRPCLRDERVPHVEGVESTAVRLAERWGEDPDDAAEAGILHDVTKAQGKEKQLKLCKKYGIMLETAEIENPALLHALTGAALAKDRFGSTDEICSAIRWHTTGRPRMTALEKIIYLADYIEPTRDFEGLEELRALCFEDLDRAMRLGLEMSIDDLAERGRPVFHDTLDAYEWYKKVTEP